MSLKEQLKKMIDDEYSGDRNRGRWAIALC